ncbi:glycerophosphodiester phosphodiesterase family protein [Streptomyces massasporeus]
MPGPSSPRRPPAHRSAKAANCAATGSRSRTASRSRRATRPPRSSGSSRRVHRDGLLVSAWTADTSRTMRKLIGNGVDSITTNRVDALAAVLRKAQG